MRRRRLFAVVALLVPSVAMATPTVTRSPSGSGTSASVVQITTGIHAGKWDLQLENTQPSSPATFTIRGLSTDQIRVITITNSTSQTVSLDIQGSSGQTGIGSIDSVDIFTSTGQNQIAQLITVGNVGSVRVNDIVAMELRNGASVTGNIDLVPEAPGGSAVLNNLVVSGSLLGNITANGGPINSVVVTGDIGTPSSPVTITTSENIGQIEAANIYAYISTPTSGTSARNVERIQATSGKFAGSLTTTNFALTTAATSSPRGLSVAGDCDATITLADTFQLPVSITGALTGSVSALINSSGNSISVGSIPTGGELWLKGYTNTTAALGAPLTVNGPIAGTLKFGRPNATERGDITSNATVTGAVSGTIQTFGNIHASATLALNGGLASTGRVLIGNSLNGAVTLPAPGGGNPGLAGQIVTNADNMISGGVGSWLGTVQVGSGGSAVTIGGGSLYEGRYSTLPSSLGGGSIGLAPFRLHKQACTPPSESASSADIVPESFFNPDDASNYRDDTDPPVRIRFYGPVEPASGLTLTETLVVQVQNPNAPCDWYDLPGVFEAVPLDNGRTIGLYVPSGNPGPKIGTYRITSASGDLLSASVAEASGGGPESRSVVWPMLDSCGSADGYLFRIGRDCDEDGEADVNEGSPPMCSFHCECDFDDDHDIGVDDLFNFLDAWFLNFGTSGTFLPGDYDWDADVDVSDLFGFLDCWFASFGNTCVP